MEVCTSEDGNDRCPPFGESLSVPNNLVLFESWKVEAGRLLPDKADLDLDHLYTLSCQPGQYMPQSYRISHFCCCSMICCYIFPNGSGMEKHTIRRTIACIRGGSIKKRLTKCPTCPSSFSLTSLTTENTLEVFGCYKSYSFENIGIAKSATILEF
jgi:hypothetical protein